MNGLIFEKGYGIDSGYGKYIYDTYIVLISAKLFYSAPILLVHFFLQTSVLSAFLTPHSPISSSLSPSPQPRTYRSDEPAIFDVDSG